MEWNEKGRESKGKVKKRKIWMRERQEVKFWSLETWMDGVAKVGLGESRSGECFGWGSANCFISIAG